MKSHEFVEYVVHDLLAHIPGITLGTMFGGHRLYLNGKIFSIIVNGELFFKVDDKLAQEYAKLNSKSFTHERNRKTILHELLDRSCVNLGRQRITRRVDTQVVPAQPKQSSSKKVAKAII